MTKLVALCPGDEARVRMPSPEEACRHRLDAGEPVIEIRRRDGSDEVYGARQVRVLAQRPAPAAEAPAVTPAGESPAGAEDPQSPTDPQWP